MSVQRNTAASSASDLEETAELPVLDVAAYEAQSPLDPFSGTDTWVAPAPPAPSRDDAALLRQRNRLEEDFKSLSANLRAVEERLALKGERLTAIEGELKQVRAEREAAEQRAESLARELTEAKSAAESLRAQSAELARRLEAQESATRNAQARDGALAANLSERERSLSHAQQQIEEMRRQLAAQLETLQSQEGRRGIFDHLLHGLDVEVGRAEAQASELKRELHAQSQRTSELTGQISGGGQRITVLEGEVNALSSALTKRNEETAAYIRSNEELRGNVRTLTSGNAAHLERIRGLEAELSAAAQAHTTALLAATNLQREIEVANAAQKKHIDSLEGELATTRGEVEQCIAALKEGEARHADRIAQLAAANARTEEVQTHVLAQQQELRALQDELRASTERTSTADSDLHAAEDALNRMESELRATNSRVEELTKADEEWRSTVDAARQALEERDSLIRRLETEAAHSTALLDNIQHSIRFLEQPASSANELTPEDAARLLIRTEGDAEVVHVLGRKMTIGRTPDNDLQIDTRFISRHHAVILTGPNHTIIEDLNSTNGVSVNGRRITRQTLKDGDHVIVGRTHFRFTVRPPGDRRVS
jgi:chromosome segregation ATPase